MHARARRNYWRISARFHNLATRFDCRKDTPPPIGFGKTISQPFMIAVMTDLLELKPDDAVLEMENQTAVESQATDGAKVAVRHFVVTSRLSEYNLLTHDCESLIL